MLASEITTSFIGLSALVLSVRFVCIALVFVALVYVGVCIYRERICRVVNQNKRTTKTRYNLVNRLGSCLINARVICQQTGRVDRHCCYAR